MKRLHADDSADSRVKVGNRQATSPENPQRIHALGVSLFVKGLVEWPASALKLNPGKAIIGGVCHEIA